MTGVLICLMTIAAIGAVAFIAWKAPCPKPLSVVVTEDMALEMDEMARRRGVLKKYRRKHRRCSRQVI